MDDNRAAIGKKKKCVQIENHKMTPLCKSNSQTNKE